MIYDIPTRVRKYPWLIMGVILAIIIICLSIAEWQGRINLTIYNPPYSIIDWARVIGGLGSVLLSGVLAYLYMKMFGTQKQQVETMQEQQRWMQVEHEPNVRIRGYDISNKGTEDILTIELENEGNGVAKNLHVRCDVRVPRQDTSSPLHPVEEKEFMIGNKPFKIAPTTTHLTQQRTTEIFSQRIRGALLHPHTSDLFQGSVNLQLLRKNKNGNQEGRSMSFQDVMLLLNKAGVEQVGVQLSLIYRDVGNKLYVDRITGLGGFLSEQYTLFGIYENKKGESHVDEDEIRESVEESNRLYP